MSAVLVAQLLAQFGPAGYELIRKLIERWNNPAPITLAEIDALEKLSQRTPRQAVIEALNKAGVLLDSPQAVALLNMVP